MIPKILFIDSDKEVIERERPIWAKRSVEIVRACSMQEAVMIIDGGGKFIAIIINVETIDYIPTLPFLRDLVPKMPIYPITGIKTPRERIIAVRNGANDLEEWCKDDTELNADMLLELISEKKIPDDRNERGKLHIFYYSNLLVILDAPFVFMGDSRVPTSAIDYSLIKFLAQHHGKPIEQDEILSNVWSEAHRGESAILQQAIKRLRDKIGAGYIENEKGYGYYLNSE